MNDSGSSLINLRPSPDTVIISCDCTVMVTSRDGLVHHKTANGLFTHRSRMLSRYEYLVDDEPLKPVTMSAIRQDESLAYYIQHAGSPSSDQTATIDTLELKVHRRVRSNGLKDHLGLTNYSQNTISFEFALKIDADFVDQSEVISDKNPPQRGTVRTRLDQPSVRVFKLTFDYQAIHRYHQQSELGTSQFNRSSEITVQCSDGKIRYLHEAIRVEIRLLPHQSKDIRVQVRPIYTAGKIRGPFENVGVYESHANSAAKQSEIELTEIVTPGRNAMAISALKTISRAANDLKALRLHDLDVTGGWVPAAGVPMYIGFFGRDAMIAGMHSLMLGPEMLRGALTQLAVWQATETDDWRDEQPGRMLHQAEIGPLAVLNYTPFRRYYGTITTPALFGWALRLLWRWTANREDVERFIEPALRAVQWLDEFCTSDCGGFYSYRKRSAKGLKNQAWKDSGEAIVDENGLQVADPIATCECQAYVYVSKLHAAELLQYLNRAEEAKALIDQAEELKNASTPHSGCRTLPL